jgi:protein-tyrosine-phosphatase
MVQGKKTILLICSGNTCRSPMAKVILEHKLKDLAKSGQFTVRSVARYTPTSIEASFHARETIKILYGRDLLAAYKPESLTTELTENSDLILVMTDGMKYGLPPAKTYSVKEYGGGAGDVMDPFGGDLDCYLECANELSSIIEKVVARLCPIGMAVLFIL